MVKLYMLVVSYGFLCLFTMLNIIPMFAGLQKDATTQWRKSVAFSGAISWFKLKIVDGSSYAELNQELGPSYPLVI